MSNDKNTNLSNFHDYGIHFPSRTIEIFNGGFEDDQIDTIIRNINILDNTTGTINLLIRSEGGSFLNAKAVYSAINVCSNYVRGIVVGYAMSSASFVLQACDERIMHPDSILMLHVGSDSIGEDHVNNVKRWYDFNKKQEVWMEDVYLRQIKKVHPRYTRKKVQSILQFDTIIAASECVKLGLADKVQEGHNHEI